MSEDTHDEAEAPDSPGPGKPGKPDAEAGGAEDRAAASLRVRVPRREFFREAPEHVPADLVERYWRSLSAVCPGRPRFEGPDVFLLIGGVMVLYGGAWLLQQVFEHAGVLGPSLLAGLAAAWLTWYVEARLMPRRRVEAAGAVAILACFLSGLAVAGVLQEAGISKVLAGSDVGGATLATLIAAAPLGIGAWLMRRGLEDPRLFFLVLGGVTGLGGGWIGVLVSPGRHLVWLLTTGWGLALLRLGYTLDRRTVQDLAAAPYSLGLILVWFQGLWMLPLGGELGWLVFAGGNLVLMSLAAALSRGMFLTCGALGVYAWLGHLSFSIFRGVLLFPFALTFVGLAIMASGIWYQRNREEARETLLGLIPEDLRPVLPDERPSVTEVAGEDEGEAEAEVDEPTEADEGAVVSSSRLDVSEPELLEVGRTLGIEPAALDSLWERLQAGNPVRARLTLAHILYFLGALTVIGSMTFFMGLCWSTLGDGAVLVLALLYAACFWAAGLHLWQEDDTKLPGGLLVTMAVCMVPLATWALQSATGLWPQGDPGAYQGLYIWVKGSWIVIEVATVAAGVVALRFVRFPFVTAPMAFALWYLSMDLTPLLVGEGLFTWKVRCYVSMGVGLVMLIGSRLLDRRTEEDYSWWGYLFGVLAFWGGMTSSGSGSLYGRLIYGLVNVAMMAVGAAIERQVFVVFGFLGFHAVVAREFYRLFGEVPGFPLIVAALGLVVVAFGRWLKRNLPWVERRVRALTGLAPAESSSG